MKSYMRLETDETNASESMRSRGFKTRRGGKRRRSVSSVSGHIESTFHFSLAIRSANAQERQPIPAPGSRTRMSPLVAGKKDAMKSAIFAGVKYCPSSCFITAGVSFACARRRRSICSLSGRASVSVMARMHNIMLLRSNFAKWAILVVLLPLLVAILLGSRLYSMLIFWYYTIYRGTWE